ncbi:hypothetical protein O1L44_04195 [Streptomyces noursei]|nr:hypothetical protein [Streptomyces noursei]
MTSLSRPPNAMNRAILSRTGECRSACRSRNGAVRRATVARHPTEERNAPPADHPHHARRRTARPPAPDRRGRPPGAGAAPRHRRPRRLHGPHPASWTTDPATTTAFARYGDDDSRGDDWTGGDGTHSVRLPDGRTLWLFSDTFLDRVHPPPNPQGAPYRWRTTDAGGTPFLRHNSLVLMNSSGTPERTLTGGTPPPRAVLPRPARRRLAPQPVHATVEPRAPAHQTGSSGCWNRVPGTGAWIFGVPRGTEVATLSCPTSGWSPQPGRRPQRRHDQAGRSSSTAPRWSRRRLFRSSAVATLSRPRP